MQFTARANPGRFDDFKYDYDYDYDNDNDNEATTTRRRAFPDELV